MSYGCYSGADPVSVRPAASNGASRMRSSPASSFCRPASSVGEDGPLLGQQVGQGGIDGPTTVVRQLDEDTAFVLRVPAAADQARSGQPVDPVGHGPGRDQRRAQQRPRTQLVRRPLPAQRRQHIKLPGLQAVGGEGGAPHPVQVPGQPGHAAEHMQGRDIQVRPLGSPARDDLVDLVPALAGAQVT